MNEQPERKQAATRQAQGKTSPSEPAWHHLQQIPEFNATVAKLAWEKGLRTFDDVRIAAENDELRELPSIGRARQASILEWLRSQSAA